MGGGRQPCWSWAHVRKLRPTSGTSHGVGPWNCNYCSNTYTGAADRVRAHLGGVRGKNVEICKGEVPLEVVNKARASFNRVELTKSSMIAASLQERLALAHEIEVGEVSGGASCGASGGATGGLGEASSGSVPLSGRSSLKRSAAPALDGDIRKMIKSAKAQCLDDAVAEFFYVENIPFNTIRRPNLRKLLQAAIDFGPGALAQMMGYEKLRSTQLKKLYDSVNARLDPVREGWRRYGVSIVTDGWSDNRSRSLINFMASNVQGSVFLKSVDSEDRTKTGEWIWAELKKVIQEVGEENVVQVITDNASNCVQMGELMTAEYPHILHSRCVCHVLDLLFEDIGGLSWVKPLVKGCNEVVTFVTKKPRVLALFRKLSNRDLIKPASTRFAYMFLVMSQLLNVTALEALNEMVVSSEWRRLDVTKTAKAQCIRNRILEETPNCFWTRCQHLLVLLGPLLKVLKLADREGATYGLIFEAMDRMNEKLSEAVETGILAEEEVEEINRFMMEAHGEGGQKAARWFQMHSILHGAAFVLNPVFLHLPLDQEAQEDFVEYLELYCKGDRGLQHKLLHEFQSFRQQLGHLMSSEAAKQMENRKHPVSWWSNFGASTPELQRLALRILSQPVCASPCERNWSSWSMIQTKRRSRLLSKNSEKLVFVHTNMRVVQKIESGSLRLIEHDLDKLELEPEWQRILELQEVVEEPLQQPEDDGASGDDVLDSEDED